MSAAARQTGRVTIDLGSGALTSKDGASIIVGGIKRTDAMSDSGVHYYKETIVPSEIDCTLIHTSDTDLVAMQAMTGLRVTFRTDTGQTFLVAPAVYKEAGALKGGEVDVKFGGPPAEKV